MSDNNYCRDCRYLKRVGDNIGCICELDEHYICPKDAIKDGCERWAAVNGFSDIEIHKITGKQRKKASEILYKKMIRKMKGAKQRDGDDHGE